MLRDMLILGMVGSITLFLLASAIQAHDYTAARTDNLKQIDSDDGSAQTGLMWTSFSVAGIVALILGVLLVLRAYQNMTLRGSVFRSE